MKMTREEVLQYVQEEDVKFIRLAFCDVYGRQKNVAVMPAELRRALEDGVVIDGSAIPGFSDRVHSDLILRPDPTTLTEMPWRPQHGRVVHLFCDVENPDGTPFPADTRHVLRQAVRAAAEQGIIFDLGSEIEFYLFRLDEDGQPTKIPHDTAGYMDIAPEDRGENVRREICLTLERMGIQPESSHHECGPGQNEIDFRYAEALAAADNAVLFQAVVKTIAAQNGLWADFSPRPLEEHEGNGMHINLSARSADGTDVLPWLIGGILDKVPEMTLFLNPSERSYARLGRDKAAGYAAWGRENRSQLIRVPAGPAAHRRLELRSPDPQANPYLAFALTIYAGLYGIRARLPLPEEARFDSFTAPSEQLAPYRRLPATRAEAARLAGQSEFVRAHLPQALIDAYCGR